MRMQRFLAVSGWVALFSSVAVLLVAMEWIFPNAIASTMKTVDYRQAVSFAIPVSWKEEDERGIQGVFYEDRPDTGTLRVSVFQWVGKDEQERNDKAMAILKSGEIDTLAKGVYLRKEVTDASEKGEPLRLHRWLVVLALPDNVCRLVVFTHAVTAAQEDDPHIVAELAMVDAAVRGASFSYETTLPLVDTP